MFGAALSWIKWPSHAHTVAHRYASKDPSTLTPVGLYQGLMFDPNMNEYRFLGQKPGTVPAPEAPYML